MSRLVLLVLVLALTAGTTLWLEEGARQERRRLGSLHALVPDTDPERVARLSFELEGRRWDYENRPLKAKEGNAWRFPAYHDAYAQGDRLNFLVSALLLNRGTPIATDGPETRYGLDPARRLPLELADAGGEILLQVWIGAGITGPDDGEAYLRRPDAPQLYHWHANPRSAIDAGRPPLIDRRVLPTALRHGAIARLDWQGPNVEARTLRQVHLAPALNPMPGGPPQRPSIAWIATFAAGTEDTCRSENVYRYLRFVQDLRFNALLPTDTARGQSLGVLTLTSDEGRPDTLEVSVLPNGRALVFNRASGLLNAVEPRRAALLFPTRAALTDSLPRP